MNSFVQTHPAIKTLSVVAPIDLHQGPPAEVPKFASNIKVSLSVPFVKNSIQLVNGVKWALEEGYVVDIDVRATVNENGEGWEGLEELLSAVTGSEENGSKPVLRGSIVLCPCLLDPLASPSPNLLRSEHPPAPARPQYFHRQTTKPPRVPRIPVRYSLPLVVPFCLREIHSAALGRAYPLDAESIPRQRVRVPAGQQGEEGVEKEDKDVP